MTAATYETATGPIGCGREWINWRTVTTTAHRCCELVGHHGDHRCYCGETAAFVSPTIPVGANQRRGATHGN